MLMLRRRLTHQNALLSGWFVAWLVALLAFCYLLFPVPPSQSSQGIYWPTTFGGSCDGGMLPLTLQPLHPRSAQRRLLDYPYKMAIEVDAVQRWHNVDYTGAPITDFIAFASVSASIQAIKADTSHRSGVRICFQQRATFNSLVATLDILVTLSQDRYCRYWLDIKHEPLTLYAITTQSAREPVPPSFL
jgi:hypothetical protein